MYSLLRFQIHILVVDLMLLTLIHHGHPVDRVLLAWADGCTFSCVDVGAFTVLQDLITMQHTQLSALT